MAQPILRIQNVTKTYATPEGGTVQALKGVSLDIAQGEFIVLLGPSGCGKTTLLRTIAGLEYPDSGEILLDGQRIDDKPAYERPVNFHRPGFHKEKLQLWIWCDAPFCSQRKKMGHS